MLSTMIVRSSRLLLFIILISSCSKNTESIEPNINLFIEFDEGLHEDPKYRLNKIDKEKYELTLWRGANQTIQRITGKVSTENPNSSSVSSKRHKVSFESNLYWWLKPGDTVASITRTYFNEFTGELVYSELPPLINWREALVPTINPSAYTDSESGSFSVVIAPILKMKNDTMRITAKVSSESGEEVSKTVSIILK